MCYSSGDRFDKDWRTIKIEWLPYEEYKKQKEEKYRPIGRGYYQKEQSPPEKKMKFESMLNRFMEAFEKRHDTTDITMINHQGSIKNIKTQLEQLTTLMNERLPPKSPNPNSQPHVMVISTEERPHSNAIEIHSEASK